MRGLISLPMYDLPEVRAATSALFHGLRRALATRGHVGLSATLFRGPPAEGWRRSDLVLSQSCGFPLTHAFREDLTVVATPCYRAPHCEGPSYRSLVVVHARASTRTLRELRGGVLAYNSLDSHSGYNTLLAEVAELGVKAPFFTAGLETGCHRASLLAVSEGRADVAAIDAVTFALLERHSPSAVAGVRILEVTRAAPALPFVTRRDVDPKALADYREALMATMADPSLRSALDALLLDGVLVLPDGSYEVIRERRIAAAQRGHDRLF